MDDRMGRGYFHLFGFDKEGSGWFDRCRNHARFRNSRSVCPIPSKPSNP